MIVDDLPKWLNTTEGFEGNLSADRITQAEWNFPVGKAADLFERLERMPVKLGGIAEIFVGLQTSADTVFLFKDVAKSSAKLTKLRSKELFDDVKLESPLLKTVVRSGSIDRYWARPTALVLFPYMRVDEEFRLIPPAQMEREFPKAWEYLSANKKLLRGREHGKFANSGWYQLYPKNLDLWERPKIMLPYMVTRLAAHYDVENNYFVNVTTGGFGITIDSQFGELTYITGLLNSKLLDWFLKKVSTTFHGGYFAANKQFLAQLPIRVVNFSDRDDRTRHDKLVKLVEKMVAAKKDWAAAEDDYEKRRLGLFCADLDREIDSLVYDLYELTDDEIAIVEGRA